MTLGERIKKVRRSKELTQQEFCQRIGFKQNSISLVETGKRNVSDQAIKSICREFSVNEKWLRYGEGEMFVEAPCSTLDALAQEYHLDCFGRTVVEKMLNLTEKQWAVFQDFAMDVLESLSEPDESDLARKVAALEKQNRELEARNRKLEGEIEEYKAFGKQAEKLAISHAISEEKPESSASSASGSGAG